MDHIGLYLGAAATAIAAWSAGRRYERRRLAQRYGQPWFRPIDRLARRDVRRARRAGPLLSATQPRVRQAEFRRVAGTDIARRTGRVRLPEDPVR